MKSIGTTYVDVSGGGNHETTIPFRMRSAMHCSLKVLIILSVLSGPVSAQRGAPGGRKGAPAQQGAANEGRPQPGPRLKIERDLEYARPEGRPLTLDVYRLDTSPTPLPVVVWIHGTNSPFATKAATPAAALVTRGGFAVASIEYRTGGGATLAMQLADAKAAVRWLRANASTYNLDAAHIGAFGYDIGGQIAALLGTTGDLTALEGDAGPLGQPSRVQAVVDVAGPMTTGGLNPISYVTSDDAPVLILHGTADDKVSTRQSQMFVSALKVAGVNSTLDLQFAVSHDLGKLLSPLSMQTVTGFLNQHLLGAKSTAALSSFIATPPDAYIDPIGLDLGGTQYKLYATPARGANTYASYRLYLPPDYQANTTRRYPVIYFLHGASVDSKRPITSGYVARIDAAIRSGVMPPTIVVIPQGLNQGWWSDSKDGKAPMESIIIKNLIPHVDATYRTIATREGRAIEGHSMGGFGALHIGFNHPDLFVAVTGNSPAIIARAPAATFGDEVYFESQTPGTLAAKNADQVRKQSIRIIVGDQDSLFPAGKKLDDVLTELKIPHEFFAVVGSPHNHDQLLQYETFDTMEFYGKVFGKAGGSGAIR